MTNNTPVSVLALWRDSGAHIDRVLGQLDRLIQDRQDINFEFYFYENDSKDNTKEKLEEWLKNKKGKLLSETLNTPKFGSVPYLERLVLLAYYRNKLKKLAEHTTSHYTLYIDSDMIFNTDHFNQLLNLMHKRMYGDKIAMIIPNTRQEGIPDIIDNRTEDSFYDAFALKDYYFNDALYFADCPLILEQDRQRWLTEDLIRVRSGFGGFSMILTEALRECSWSSWGNSEHVNFCLEVEKFGNIYIAPKCKPISPIEIGVRDTQQWSQQKESQIKRINAINQAHMVSISDSIKYA